MQSVVVSARYVEVNCVRAKVIGSGVCVKNGIVHKVDQILGIPGRTIYQEIEKNPILRWVAEWPSCFFSVSTSCFMLQPVFGDNIVTIFGVWLNIFRICFYVMF